MLSRRVCVGRVGLRRRAITPSDEYAETRSALLFWNNQEFSPKASALYSEDQAADALEGRIMLTWPPGAADGGGRVMDLKKAATRMTEIIVAALDAMSKEKRKRAVRKYLGRRQGRRRSRRPR